MLPPSDDSKQDVLSASEHAQAETGHHLPTLGHSPSMLEGQSKFQRARGFLGLSAVTLGVIYG